MPTDRDAAAATPSVDRAFVSDAVDQADDGIFLVDGPSGTILYANPSGARLLGYDLDEVVGEHAWEVATRYDSEAAWRAVADELGEARSLNVATNYQRPDGRTVPARVTLQHIQVDGREVILAVARAFDVDWALDVDLHRLAAIVESSQDPILGLTPLGTITEWNPAAEEVYGYTAAEALGRGIELIVPPDKLDELDDLMARLRAGEHIDHLETQRVTKDGARVDISLSLSPILDRRGRIVGAAVVERDGTAKHAAERRLQRMAAVVESTDDAVITKTLDGIITDWNQAAEQMYGYTAAEATGEHISLIVPEDKWTELEGIMARLRAGERIDHFETQRVAKGGRVLDVSLTISPLHDGQGRIVGASKIARDITERKRIEARLGRLASIVGSSHDAIIVRRLDGAVTEWNPAAEALYGYTADEMLGQPYGAIVPVDLEEEAATFEQVVQTGGGVEAAETQRVTKSGHRVDVSLTLWPLRDERGQIVAIASIARDITERKETERALRRSNEELERFAQIASHDLKEPLRMTASYVQLLERRYADGLDEDASDYIGFAVEGVERMRALIDDLLTYARLGSEEPAIERVDVREIVETAWATVAGSTDRPVEFDVGELPTIQADRSQLQRLFNNLLSNAAKFHGAHPAKVTVEAERSDEGWTITVADNGIGIPKEHQDKVFEAFQRLESRESYPGTGIGLAICKRIVEHHEGDIWIESEAGEGTRVHVALPDRQAGPARRVEALAWDDPLPEG